MAVAAAEAAAPVLDAVEAALAAAAALDAAVAAAAAAAACARVRPMLHCARLSKTVKHCHMQTHHGAGISWLILLLRLC